MCFVTYVGGFFSCLASVLRLLSYIRVLPEWSQVSILYEILVCPNGLGAWSLETFVPSVDLTAYLWKYNIVAAPTVFRPLYNARITRRTDVKGKKRQQCPRVYLEVT